MSIVKKIIFGHVFLLLSVSTQAGVELVCTPSTGCNTVNDLGTGGVIVNGEMHSVQHPGGDLYIIDGKNHMIRPNNENSFFIDGELEQY